MRVVLEPNVLVSGLLNPYRPPGRIVDLILSGRIQVLYDDRILGEYLEVLARPQLAIDSSLAQAVLGHIRLAGERIMGFPLPDNFLPDPDDLPFAEAAISGKVQALITGNGKHFLGVEDRAVPVLSPAQFMQRFV
jgi:putative PIN family toxin of toxin-antitoxin system